MHYCIARYYAEMGTRTANVGLVKDRTGLIRRVEMVRLDDMFNMRDIHS